MSNERLTISRDYCDGVGDGLRYAYGGTDQYYPSQWENAIKGLKKTLGTKNINANGDYPASADNLDGFSGVSVDVPNTYTQADEGKVVDSGALVAQTSKNINSNGTHTTTTNNQVMVAVPNSYSASDEGKVIDNGALVAQTSKTITTNGTHVTTTNNEVIVNVPTGGGGSALAKIGGSSTISSLSGLYAMGSSTSYFHPVDSNGDDIEINKAQPFEIKCTFRLTEYPVYAGNRCYDLFGSSAHQSYLPRIEMWYDTEMSNPDMSFFNIDVSDTQGHYISFGDANNALTIPLNTDITIVFTFTGSSVTCTLDMGNTHLSETLNNIEFDQYSVGTYPCEFGAIDDDESGSFARIPGSYFNIDQCYVKQGSTKIWGVTGGGDGKIKLVMDDYITFNGSANQVIVLPYTVNSDYTIDVDFEATNTGDNNSIIGTSGNYTWPHVTIYNNKWYVSTGGNDLNFSKTLTERHTITLNKNSSVFFDNEAVLTNLSAQSSQYQYWIGGRGDSVNNRAKAKLYEYKLTSISTGDVICDLLPAHITYRNGDVIAGLYDSTNDVFYGNANITEVGTVVYEATSISQTEAKFINDYSRNGAEFVGVTVGSSGSITINSVKAEYYGNTYGNSTMIADLGLVLLGDFSQGGNASGNILSDSIANYSGVLLQGIYSKQQTSNYNTTYMYCAPELNTAYWAGMKDRNSTYTCYVTFTNNSTVSLTGNKQVIIYGIP